MPQVVPALSSQSNNPSSNGRAFIDLRGLGNNRNLVRSSTAGVAWGPRVAVSSTSTQFPLH